MLGELICSALVLTGTLAAQEHNQLTPKERAAGWILLFDGKTMKGWEDPSKKTPPGDSYTVADGCLKATKKARYTEDLFTVQRFKDFELEFDWRISPGGNSGVKYRIQDRVWVQEQRGKKFEDQVAASYANRKNERPDKGQEYVVGFEYQCIDNEGHPDGRRGGSHASGALYDFVAPTSNATKPVGEFNHSRLVVKGSKVEHWLNGVKVVETDLKAPAIGEASVKRWGQGSDVARFLTEQPVAECPISLQNHGDEAWFRDIKIRPLK